MRMPGEQELLAAAEPVFSDGERVLFGELMEFVSRRLEGAEESGRRILHGGPTPESATERELHAFLRDCWDALDGLGRLINVALAGAFPDVGLYPSDRMTRQCTLYTVRRALRADPDAACHPVSEWLWAETRDRPDAAYERLSFLHNLSVFVPLRLTRDGMLPGCEDVPPAVRRLVRPCSVQRCSVGEGVADVLEWLRGFAGRCCELLAESLRERG